MNRLILASTSISRNEVFAKVGVPFEQMASPYEEDNTLDLPPAELVQQHAIGKAQAVADTLSDGFVIGADTIEVFGDEKLFKPKSKAEARATLQRILGKSVMHTTGWCVINAATGEKRSGIAQTELQLREASDEEIDFYLESEDPTIYAGGFGPQGYSMTFITGTKGDHHPSGLPMYALFGALQELGYELN